MKIYISYFYQLRFFPRNAVPLSTAVYDPAWFHEGTRNQEHKFKDRRGVWNGLRAEPFMPGAACEGLCHGPEYCGLRPDDVEAFSPTKCSFLRRYLVQLNMLDFDEMMNRFEKLGKTIQNKEGFLEEPIAILLVHEAPDNPCSERWPLIKWFADHGYELEEWHNG